MTTFADYASWIAAQPGGSCSAEEFCEAFALPKAVGGARMGMLVKVDLVERSGEAGSFVYTATGRPQKAYEQKPREQREPAPEAEVDPENEAPEQTRFAVWNNGEVFVQVAGVGEITLQPDVAGKLYMFLSNTIGSNLTPDLDGGDAPAPKGSNWLEVTA